MTQHGLSEPEAFRWIQRAAMDNRTSMRAVAELVLSGDDAASRRLLPSSRTIAATEPGGDLVTTAGRARRRYRSRRVFG